MRICIEISCKCCRDLDRPFNPTPGGGGYTCGHKEAARSFFPGPGDFDAERLKYFDSVPGCAAISPTSWKHRIVDIREKEPPQQCPLRKYEVKT